MFPKFSQYFPQPAVLNPASLAPVPRQPLSNEPAFMTLAPNIGISDAHAISTGQSSTRYVHWLSSNTVDLGNVVEDVQGIKLSGHHTFPDQVLNAALEAQRSNPGLNLYLGIPPQNPQKFVLMANDVMSRHAQGTGIVIPLDVRRQRDTIQGSGVGKENTALRRTRDRFMQFLDTATCGCISSGSQMADNPSASRGGPSGRTHEERAAELKRVGEDFRRGLDDVETRHGLQPGVQTDNGMRRQTASSSNRARSRKHTVPVSSPSFQTKTPTGSIQDSSRVRDAGHTPMHRTRDLVGQPDSSRVPESPSTETIEPASVPNRRSFHTQSWLPGLVGRIPKSQRPEGSGQTIQLKTMSPAAPSSSPYRELPHLSGFTPSSTSGGRVRASDQPIASSLRSHPISPESRNIGSSGSPPPLSYPVDWQEVKEILNNLRSKHLANLTRDHIRNAMRQQLGLPSRPGASALPEATESSSLPPDDDDLPIFLAITDKNKYAVATRALQDAIGTRPGVRNEVQQRGWAGLLGYTLQAYDNVLDARQNGMPGDVDRLEVEMRNSLRELLYLSNATNIFNFRDYAPPESDNDLDTFVSLPQFRMLAEAVNEVHQRLEAERPRPDDPVAFANSPHNTYADDMSRR